jgi:pyruvate dehydrogenase E1 component beta subunit
VGRASARRPTAPPPATHTPKKHPPPQKNTHIHARTHARTRSPQVINLRSIKPLDRDTIAASVAKTHRLVSVEEGWPQSGVGAEIAALAMEACFDDLDAPMGRVTGAEVPTPYAANLEAQCFPQAADVAARIKQTLGRA